MSKCKKKVLRHIENIKKSSRIIDDQLNIILKLYEKTSSDWNDEIEFHKIYNSFENIKNELILKRLIIKEFIKIEQLKLNDLIKLVK